MVASQDEGNVGFVFDSGRLVTRFYAFLDCLSGLTSEVFTPVDTWQEVEGSGAYQLQAAGFLGIEPPAADLLFALWLNIPELGYVPFARALADRRRAR